MSSTQREYSGWLAVQLKPRDVASVAAAAERVGLQIDLDDTYMEFEYAGPDSNRFVVAFLQEIAPMVGVAEGEIRCEVVSDDAEDPTFEFYQFKGGGLTRQYARLVREPPELVPVLEQPWRP
jgi:hypothetical protein